MRLFHSNIKHKVKTCTYFTKPVKTLTNDELAYNINYLCHVMRIGNELRDLRAEIDLIKKDMDMHEQHVKLIGEGIRLTAQKLNEPMQLNEIMQLKADNLLKTNNEIRKEVASLKKEYDMLKQTNINNM